ncbi:MAG: VOC family protein [Candidatus Binataceae bacterium]|nr:VOC family protein [Candidatus Binataceae bacterium]
MITAVKQLGYIGLGASNLEAWERYAAEILGLQLCERGSDGTLYFRMDEFHHRISVHPDPADDLKLLGWEVADQSALDQLAAQIKDWGTEVQHGTPAEAAERAVYRLIKFTDPSGIASEAYYGALKYNTPFRSPRPISGFLTGEDFGMGHVVIAVDDFDRSASFYQEALGMRVTDIATPSGQRAERIGISSHMIFLHCNLRHHSIAFGSGSYSKRLNHFLLQVRDIDDVGATFDLCLDREVPLVSSIGKHANDLMISFYMKTPSGFGCEFGYGGREVDDRTWKVVMNRVTSLWGHRTINAL